MSVLLSCLLACTDAADTAASAPDVEPPDSAGPWAVGHRVDSLQDVGEVGRAVSVDLWYPVEPAIAAAAEPAVYELLGSIGLTSPMAVDGAPGAGLDAPLLIFSHGYHAISTQSSALMEALASHGFVVAAPTHTGNSQADQSDDFETAASRRVPDVAAVIDWLRSGDAPLSDQTDPDTVGVLGHSFGGMTAIGVGAGWAGAAPIDGVDALLPISAVIDAELQADDRPHDSAGFTAGALATIAQPVLLLGGTEDTSVPIDNNALAFEWLTSAESVVRADIIGANHTHFANVCDIGSLLIEMGITVDLWPALGAGDLVEPYADTCSEDAFSITEAIRLQKQLAVSFFRLHLLGEADYEWWLTEASAAQEEALQLWVKAE